MPRPALSRPTLACAALCAAVVAIAAADLAHARARVPPAPPANCSGDPACEEARDAELADRLREADRLEQQLGSRSWLYASAISAAILLATALGLRSRRRQEWPRAFMNIGIAGASSGILLVLLLVAANGGSPVSLRPAPTLAPAVTMLAAATLGIAIGRVERWHREPGVVDDVRGSATAVGKVAIEIGTGGAASRSQLERLARWLVTACLTLTVLTVVLAAAFVAAQPDCDGTEIAPDWTETVGSISAISAVAALAAATGALLMRRRLPALICLVANPLVGVAMLASTCAFQ